MLKKAAAMLTIALLMLMMVPCYASADGPPPAENISVEVTGTSGDVAFIELLIPKDLPDVSLSNINSYQFSKHPELNSSDLIHLNSDGYISYSLYFKDANLDKYVSDNFLCFYFANGQLDKFKTIKIVSLNRDGHILKISNVISLVPGNFQYLAAPLVRYDYSTNIGTANIMNSNLLFGIILLPILGLPRILFTVIIEIIIALFFKIKPLLLIGGVNVVTQTFITIATSFFSVLFPYVIVVAVCEVIVVLIEYLAYMKFTREPKKRKVLIYTLVANASSLSLGLLLNYLGVFKF